MPQPRDSILPHFPVQEDGNKQRKHVQRIDAGNAAHPECAFRDRMSLYFVFIAVRDNKSAENKEETYPDKSFLKDIFAFLLLILIKTLNLRTD